MLYKQNVSVRTSSEQIDSLPKIKLNQKSKPATSKGKPGKTKRSKPDLNSSNGDVSRQTRQQIRKQTTSSNRTLNKSYINNNSNRKNKQ